MTGRPPRPPVVHGGAARFALLGGIAVGHATDDAGATGLTVVRGTAGALRAGAAVVGRATGTRELLPLTTHHLVDRVDAVLLTGGSAYGLDAAAGVMRWMEERGRGFAVGPGQVVPIVPAAVIFDLAPLGRFDARPTPAMAYEACERATSGAAVEEGSVGVGTGATVGKAAGVARAMKGGVGCAVASSSDDDATALHVGALAVVNALGDVRDARGAIVAGARDDAAGFLDATRLLAGADPAGDAAERAMHNTTLAVVIVGTPLSRVALQQVAAAATAALHRRVTPAGTSLDGDVVFALSPIDGDLAAVGVSDAVGGGDAAHSAGGPPHRDIVSTLATDHHPSDARGTTPSPAALMRIEVLAVAALEHALERAVRLARGRDGIPGLGDVAGSADPRPEVDREDGEGRRRARRRRG